MAYAHLEDGRITSWADMDEPDDWFDTFFDNSDIFKNPLNEYIIHNSKAYYSPSLEQIEQKLRNELDSTILDDLGNAVCELASDLLNFQNVVNGMLQNMQDKLDTIERRLNDG